MRNSSVFMFATCLLLTATTPACAQEIDSDSGLIIAPGWQVVQATCTSCHSSQIIVQNSGSRDVWHSRIVWMQETQGLQQLEPDVESRILDYLESNYGPRPATRRANLPPHLLPANPHTR